MCDSPFAKPHKSAILSLGIGRMSLQAGISYETSNSLGWRGRRYSCGAVNATVTALQKGDTLPVHIADLVRAMKPGIERVLKQSGDDLQQRAVVANMRYNAQRLRQREANPRRK